MLWIIGIVSVAIVLWVAHRIIDNRRAARYRDLADAVMESAADYLLQKNPRE